MHYQIISNDERTAFGFEILINSRKWIESELTWESKEEAEQAANWFLGPHEWESYQPE